MKYCLSVLLLFILHIAVAQTIDSANMPLYLKTRQVPSFKLLKMDSTTFFYKYQLKKKMPTIMFVFNPNCGHCEIETKNIIDSMKYLKKAQFVFVSSGEFYDLKRYDVKHKLSSFKNITLCRDEKYFMGNFYKLRITPFVVVYNKEGNLVNAYPGGTSVLNLSEAVK